MSTLTIQLPERLKSKLAAAAKRQGLSPEQLAQQALEATLTGATPLNKPSLYEQSHDLCGTVNGGPRDLARNKKHLRAYPE